MPDALPQTVHDIRRVTVGDLAWVMSLGYRRYGPYDPGKILMYLLDVMKAPEALFIRTENAFLLAAVIRPVWGSKNNEECNVLALCCDEGAHWQGIKLLRRSVEWARERGCQNWWFASETKYDVSILSKRVGAKVAPPRYKIEFR